MENKTTDKKLKYISDHPDFQGFITIVASELNLSAGIIEKDYWVIRALRELQNSEFQNEFVFKGGTCLSKAWKLIERFSEDIDLLFLSTNCTTSKNSKKRRLKEFSDFIANIPGLSIINEKSIVKKLSAALYFDYNKNNELDREISSYILLEPGYRGGIVPRIFKKPINSFIGEYLMEKGFENLAEDLPPFEVQVLSLERILAEKLCAIKSLYEKNSLKTRTRHYYDIYNLLDTLEIKGLSKNKGGLILILEDISSISEEYFNLEKTTFEDIKLCDALNPKHECMVELEYEYKKSKALYYNIQPEFNEMILKISCFLNSFN